MCAHPAASQSQQQQLITSNWKSAMTATLWNIDIVVIGVKIKKIIESSMRKSAKIGRHCCIIENYLHSPMRRISVSARSASCRCRLIRIRGNLGFIHAAASWFAKDVFMPILWPTNMTRRRLSVAHSVESRLQIRKKIRRKIWKEWRQMIRLQCAIWVDSNSNSTTIKETTKVQLNI